MDYQKFLDRKFQLGGDFGFDPVWMPDFLFDFQKYLVNWALLKGRGAIFADCGMGKTVQQLVWAQNLVQKFNKPVLILTPLSVSHQTVQEAKKFGIECKRSEDGKVASKITVTNYERLHYFDPSDFPGGVVCDEASILKHFGGEIQKQVTRFLLKVPYRLLCTATAAPNDYYELGTSSEALGYLGYSDMLSRFFVQSDCKNYRMNDVKLHLAEHRKSNHYMKLAYRASQQIAQWRLKGHAEMPFWRWVASWARVCRKPSDFGFSDEGFVLPELKEHEHIIIPKNAPTGKLLTVPAFGLKEEREERRRTLGERCELVAKLVAHKDPAIVWCDYNIEGDLLEKLIPDAVQVSGANSDDFKERVMLDFVSGKVRVLITKAKIAGFGMNFQHCAHVVMFATHSYERYYQSIRRCWRFGQMRPVRVDVVLTEGERRVRENMVRKDKAAAEMFIKILACMNDAVSIERSQNGAPLVRVPQWL